MDTSKSSNIERTLRWYRGHSEVSVDLQRVQAGGPLALVGGPWDDLEGFADRLAPERPVFDITDRVPSAREVKARFADAPDTIVLARTGESAFRSLGLLVQPWYMRVWSLSARPQAAIPLLREAIHQLGVEHNLDDFGAEAVAKLARYKWPRGLHEIRETSCRLAAVLERGNMSAAARRLRVSRQAVSKFVNRRLA
jgi:hypothetical protein